MTLRVAASRTWAPANSRTDLRGWLRRVWLPLSTWLLLATTVGTAGPIARAAFTQETVGAPTIVIHDDRGERVHDAMALFGAVHLAPGEFVERDLHVQNVGGSPVRLQAAAQVLNAPPGPLWTSPSGLQARVTEPASGTVLYEGHLSRLATARPALLAAGQQRVFRLAIGLAPEADVTLAAEPAQIRLVFQTLPVDHSRLD